jgi:hypothetical protein
LRPTAQDWQNLLNNYGTQFWDLASYGQTQAQFTVLPSPLSPDGWWNPPHAAADYYVNGDLFADYKSFAFVEDGARGARATATPTRSRSSCTSSGTGWAC